MDENEKNSGYESFGEFNFYKQHILQYLFNIAEHYSKLQQILPIEHSSRIKELGERYDFLVGLKSFLLLLLPKIKKLKKPEEFNKLNNIKTLKLKELAENHEEITELYYLTTALIEELGYSDMSIKKDEDYEIEW